MEPAASIIKKLGGEARVAAITGTAYTAPYRWQYARAKGGTDGQIPQRYHRVLLDHAAATGVALEPGDFLPPLSQPAERPGEGDRPAGDGGADPDRDDPALKPAHAEAAVRSALRET